MVQFHKIDGGYAYWIPDGQLQFSDSQMQAQGWGNSRA